MWSEYRALGRTRRRQTSAWSNEEVTAVAARAEFGSSMAMMSASRLDPDHSVQ
jgi:hypothetical protein